MWKWILKKTILILAEPIVDAIIQALEKLAKRTGNTIDDEFVSKFKEFREAIIGFIHSQANNIIKAI